MLYLQHPQAEEWRDLGQEGEGCEAFLKLWNAMHVCDFADYECCGLFRVLLGFKVLQ